MRTLSGIGLFGLLATAAAAGGSSVAAGAAVDESVLDDRHLGQEEFKERPSAEAVPEVVEAAAALSPDEENLAVHDYVELEQRPFIGDAFSSLAANAEVVAEKVKVLAGKYGPGKHRGSTLALVGLMGTLLFLLMHAASQKVNGQPVSSEVLFKVGDGRLTFTGAGTMASLVLTIMGLMEAISKPRSRVRGAPLAFPNGGKEEVSVGYKLVTFSTIAITLGWLFSLPAVFMIAATSAFVCGATLMGLGGFRIINDLRRDTHLARELYELGVHGVSPMSEGARMDLATLNGVLGHFLAGSAAHQVGATRAARGIAEEEPEAGDAEEEALLVGAGRANLGSQPHRQQQQEEEKEQEEELEEELEEEKEEEKEEEQEEEAPAADEQLP